jgi:hypothetical protein
MEREWEGNSRLGENIEYGHADHTVGGHDDRFSVRKADVGVGGKQRKGM